MQNVVPESSLLSAQMRPPWFSTIDFAIVKQNTNKFSSSFILAVVGSDRSITALELLHFSRYRRQDKREFARHAVQPTPEKQDQIQPAHPAKGR